MTRRIVVFSNDQAGSSEEEVLDRVLAVLGRAGPVERMSIDDIDRSGGFDPAGVDLLVAAGGDGTVHHLVAGLHRKEVELASLPMAVVPLGTGNDLSRSLGLDPDDPVAAAEIAICGSAEPVDLVRRANGIMVNVAHAGLGAVAAEIASDAKSSLGGLAYPVGAVIAAVRSSGWELEVRVDGELVAEGPTLLVGVGNGRTIGGGTPMFPEADLSDGLVDIVISHSTGLVDRAGFGLALRDGSHGDRDDVTTLRGSRVEIVGEAVAHNVDGEVGEERTEEVYEVLPGALALVRAGR